MGAGDVWVLVGAQNREYPTAARSKFVDGLDIRVNGHTVTDTGHQAKA